MGFVYPCRILLYQLTSFYTIVYCTVRFDVSPTPVVIPADASDVASIVEKFIQIAFQADKGVVASYASFTLSRAPVPFNPVAFAVELRV